MVVAVPRGAVAGWVTVEDTRGGVEVRGAALAALGWLWAPCEESIDYLASLASKKELDLKVALAEALWRFALRCRRHVAYLRVVNDRLSELIDAAARLAYRIPSAKQGAGDYRRVREAVVELSLIKRGYDEYAARQFLVTAPRE